MTISMLYGVVICCTTIFCSTLLRSRYSYRYYYTDTMYLCRYYKCYCIDTV